MSSNPGDIPSSEEETTFDTYEIDYKIFKDGEFTKKSNSKPFENKFKLIPGLTQEELQKKR